MKTVEVPMTGVILPANWEQQAARAGLDPQLVQMQKDTYGWTVGTEVVEVGALRVVYIQDYTPYLLLAWFTMLVLFAPFAITFGMRIPLMLKNNNNKIGETKYETARYRAR